MTANTPIPYWLSLPLVEILAWANTVLDIQGSQREGSR